MSSREMPCVACGVTNQHKAITPGGVLPGAAWQLPQIKEPQSNETEQETEDRENVIIHIIIPQEDQH